MDGLLLVDKPSGISSFGVVARVRGIIRAQTGQKIKIGHTGTLDPAASGLMILALGKYTKRAGEFSKLDKTYQAEITLGAKSSTGDSEGEIEAVRGESGEVREPTIEQIEVALEQFKGKIEQVPPIFSALKIGGQRAYKLARQGKEVKMEPRQVRVERLEVREYHYPILKVVTGVSSGTYIRTLAEDIGAVLGTGAYLSALRRTTVGQFNINDAASLDKLDFATISSNIMKDQTNG